MPGDKSRKAFGSFFIDVYIVGSPSSGFMLSYCRTDYVQKRLPTGPTQGYVYQRSDQLKSAFEQRKCNIKRHAATRADIR